MRFCVMGGEVEGCPRRSVMMSSICRRYCSATAYGQTLRPLRRRDCCAQQRHPRLGRKRESHHRHARRHGYIGPTNPRHTPWRPTFWPRRTRPVWGSHNGSRIRETARRSVYYPPLTRSMEGLKHTFRPGATLGDSAGVPLLAEGCSAAPGCRRCARPRAVSKLLYALPVSTPRPHFFA